jgi:hypothetical protein
MDPCFPLGCVLAHLSSLPATSGMSRAAEYPTRCIVSVLTALLRRGPHYSGPFYAGASLVGGLCYAMLDRSTSRSTRSCQPVHGYLPGKRLSTNRNVSGKKDDSTLSSADVCFWTGTSGSGSVLRGSPAGNPSGSQAPTLQQ